MRITVAHSPDSDDAFMFYGLACGAIATDGLVVEQVLADIETLNRRAFEAELELTAVSIHAYAYLSDAYALCACGASMGDQYGPMVVAREPGSLEQLKEQTIAVPGTLTSAYLALRLCLQTDFKYVVVPFDQIIEVTAAGEFNGEPVDAGLIIHEGQLTFATAGLHLVVDLGAWWKERTGLPLPLGGNAIRRDVDGRAIERHR